MIATVETLSDQEAMQSSPMDFTSLPNLAYPGQFQWKMLSGILRDETRQRRFPYDLYLPFNSPQPVPVVVISHGLASNRNSP